MQYKVNNNNVIKNLYFTLKKNENHELNKYTELYMFFTMIFHLNLCLLCHLLFLFIL